jgi:cytoskeletal protein CcmA (bactofilin family)
VVRIDGEVQGDISGVEKVVVTKTGRVQGNIVAPRVTLEDGAKFKGSIDMDPSGMAAVAKPVSTARPVAVESASSEVASKG